MITPAEVEARIREDIATAIAKGYRIVPGGFGEDSDGSRRCCALGAVAVATRGRVWIGESLCAFAEDELGITPSQRGAIASGFDGGACAREYNFYAVGQRLRAEFVK